jgi:acyl carrier protein
MGIVKKELGEILRIAPESLEERRALHDLGLDSLMGVELMAAVEARFGVKIPIMALTEVGTIERLVKRIVRELRRSLEPSDGAAAQPSLEEHVRSLAAQHAPELAQGQLEEVAAELRARTAEGTQLGAK